MNARQLFELGAAPAVAPTKPAVKPGAPPAPGRPAPRPGTPNPFRRKFPNPAIKPKPKACDMPMHGESRAQQIVKKLLA